jgi:hypothetical protein
MAEVAMVALYLVVTLVVVAVWLVLIETCVFSFNCLVIVQEIVTCPTLERVVAPAWWLARKTAAHRDDNIIFFIRVRCIL